MCGNSRRVCDNDSGALQSHAWVFPPRRPLVLTSGLYARRLRNDRLSQSQKPGPSVPTVHVYFHSRRVRCPTHSPDYRCIPLHRLLFRILQLLVTIIFQLFILRDVERLAGCLRVAVIYTASGVIGNLGSAIFLPYQAEVGPMGSQFGIIACLFVEMFHAWSVLLTNNDETIRFLTSNFKKREIYQNPCFVLFKLLACLLLLILIGFLPMIDNFANVFGFLSGLLLSSILFPNINLKGRCRRVLMISICISFVVVFVSGLVVLFYIRPIEKCDFCKMLSCPLGDKYCLEMDFNVTRLV